MGADQVLGPLDLDEVGAPPLALWIARHVGDDAVRVELGIEVAAGEVAEGGRHEAVALDAGAPAGGGVPAPGLQQFPLDEVEGGRHRLVVGADDPGGRLRGGVDQGFEGNRLRGGEGDVETGAVLVLAVPQAPEPGLRAGGCVRR